MSKLDDTRPADDLVLATARYLDQRAEDAGAALDADLPLLDAERKFCEWIDTPENRAAADDAWDTIIRILIEINDEINGDK